ncbi:MAG: THxN family PEP-CTERM protein [Pseudomonadota bacterium]
MKKILGLLGLLSTMLVAVSANAAMITQWSFDEALNWTSATFSAGNPSNPGTQTTTSTELSWGGTGPFTTPNLPITDARSALVITNDTLTGVSLFTNGPTVATNTITHYNNAISIDFKALTTATMLNTLTLTPVAPPDASLPQFSQTFAVKFIETPNDGLCFDGTTNNCPDIFVITAGNLTSSFTLNGFLYTLDITANGLGNLSDAACLAAGAAVGCVGIITQENAFTSANFAVDITAVPVPEPGQMALLAIGLLGLYFVRGRKSAKL